jgi:hypothetical protein
MLLQHTVCIESFLPIGWRTAKICQSAAIFWFGSRNVGILLIFFSSLILQRTIVGSPTFLEPGWAEKDSGLCLYNPSAKEVGGLDGFLYEAAQNFEVFSNIQD